MNPSFQINASNDGLSLAGRLDSNSAGEAEAAISSHLSSTAGPVVLDCARLEYLSSAGLRLLLSAAKTLKTQQRELVIRQPTSTVRRILELSGFDAFLRLERA